MQRSTRETILLIEADASLRRLISLGLHHRGMQVIDVSSPGELGNLEKLAPGLVILDVDGEAGSDHSLLAELQSHPILSHVPAVVLAWDCLLTEGIQPDSRWIQLTCLTKPFDARTLHTTIEDILIANKTAGSWQKQQALPTYAASPSPSIWPLVTAAGLLLLIIGLMVQVIIALLGLLIVIVALLLWTLGTKPEQQPIALEVQEAWRG
jgi:DNA-binding NtrC family response regulator